jgi:putative ABC transport system permease protein
MSARLLRKCAALFQRRRLERELAEEIETHRAFVEEQAGAETARIMGNVTLAREESREIWSFRSLEWIFQDAWLAMRGLRRSPVFAVVAIASLALGIGANTAIFSFVNAILLKRLPVPQPEQLVTFGYIDHGERTGLVWRLDDIDNIAKRAATLNGIFGWFYKPVSFSKGDSAEWVSGEIVTGQFFRTLQVQPAIGRLFNDDDVRNAGGDPVCVLSYAFWQREFAGDTAVLERKVLLNGQQYRVLGVSARGFYGATLGRRFDIAVPATRVADFMPVFGGEWMKRLSWLAPMARLKHGVTRSEARSQLEHLSPDWRKRELVLGDGSQGLDSMQSQFGRPLMTLMAVVALVLLVACANLANLLLARAQARTQEFAIRSSLGASRGRVVRQLLVESLMLALAGGAAGIALSFWISDTLLGVLNTGRSVTYAVHVTPDGRVLAFALALSVATALLFGWAPAWQSTRPAARGRRALVRPGFLRPSLVVFQIALSMMIVFAAGLLTRTLGTLAATDLGFRADRVIAMIVDPAANGHSASESTLMLDQILRRVRSLPHVKAASLALSPPFGATSLSQSITIPGLSWEPVVVTDLISPHYFETMGQTLLRGRDFDEHDARNSARVAIVNEKLARHYFGGRDPVGLKFQEGQVKEDIEIVGVVKDATEGNIRTGAPEIAYLPEKQSRTSGLVLLARTADEPRRVIPSLFEIVKSIDPRLPVFSVHTLDVDVQMGLSSERMLGFLSSLFAALATLLAGIGLYGVIAYSVTRRRREIGIRFAVGAQRGDVAGLFARESLALVLAGLAIGAPVALVAARALGSLLFGVTAADPVTLAASIAMLALAAVLATLMPLLRAARTDPMAALRHE